MGIPVGFPRVMVSVVLAEGRESFQPLVDVLDQPALVVVDVNAGGDVHGGNEDHAFGDAALSGGALPLRRGVDILAVLLALEGQVFRLKINAFSWSGNPVRPLNLTLLGGRIMCLPIY